MIRVADLSIVFLSYDEPRREEFWADLQAKFPRALRSHGVKGLDRGFKAAIMCGETDHVITVDADSVVDAAFFESALEPAILRPNTRIDWPARNAVNGVVSGNGAMKCWPKALARVMRSHETAPPEARSVDFPVSPDIAREDQPQRVEQPLPMSTVYCNGSPLQAFRSGFRQAVRLGLPKGRVRSGRILSDDLDPRQRHWLAIWCSVGADVENGLWCLYGARLACHMVHLDGWDYLAINDFDWFDRFWHETIAPRFAGTQERCERTGHGWDRDRLQAAIHELGKPLRLLLGIDVVELDAARSQLFKRLYRPLPSLSRIDSLGTMFRRGIGVAHDVEKAAFCYQLAASVGYPNALNSLARIHRTGEGVAIDLQRAAALLREAIALGNHYAPHQLGRLYREGLGVARDPGRALELFDCATERGFAGAHRDIAEMYERGEGVAADLERALQHYELAGGSAAGLESKIAELRQRIATRAG